MSRSFQDLATFIWSVADLLRGPYRPPQYERVMLPLTVLRRFDCVLAPTKPVVLRRYEQLKDGKLRDVDPILNTLAVGLDGKPLGFHNHSPLDFEKLKGDPDTIAANLDRYIRSFSKNVQDIFDRFDFYQEIDKLAEANRLYLIIARFAEIDLHPSRVDNITMGLIFEDLIRRFNEAANETAGDHFTPREVIRLMVNLLLEPDSKVLTVPHRHTLVCDPACGTGGMLSEAENWIREHNDEATVEVFGQDYNPRSYAVAASDLLIKGQHARNIHLGDTLLHDPFPDLRFDYLLANPPFGVDWKAQQKEIDRRGSFYGYKGKLPRVNDGALLFLLYMLSKRRDPKQEGTRIAIVFNGSPLFTGGAGSGESEIRRWIIQNDWLEAIIALPEQMFYNTGIGTFVWVVTNRKLPDRKGTIQLIDARERWSPMRRSLGDKRRYLSDETISALTREHGAFRASDTCKLFDNQHFGYRRITVERPLRLRFQITVEAKEIFLDACPEFLDVVRTMEGEFGADTFLDWNKAWEKVQVIAKAEGARWSGPGRKLFRQVFTVVDPDAQPVIATERKVTPADDLGPDFGWYPLPVCVTSLIRRRYEADPALRDFENVPLKEDVHAFFIREVRPFVADAWIDPEVRDEQDGEIGKVGYEINFNRVFLRYEPPRPLAEIDAELKQVEARILSLLQEVTE